MDRAGRERVPRLVLVALLLVPTLFLLSPHVSRQAERRQDFCAKRVDLGGPLHVYVNCDSGEWVIDALHPMRLFRKGSIRQERPLFPVAAAAVTAPARPVAQALGVGHLPYDVEPLFGRRAHQLDKASALTAYAAYVLISFALLACALVLFHGVMASSTAPWQLVSLLGIFLVGNQVVKAFIWTPDTQAFIVFGPILTLYVARRLLLAPARNPMTVVAIGLGFGILSLAYAIFLASLPALGMAQLIGARRSTGHESQSLLTKPVALVVAGILAAAAWPLLLLAKTGHYYNNEATSTREVVWISDAARLGLAHLAHQTVANLAAFGRTAVRVLWRPAAVLGPAALAFWSARRHGTSFTPAARATVEAAALTLAAFALFWAFLGAYDDRQTWSLVPEVVVIAGVLAQSSWASLSRRARIVLVVLVAVVPLGGLTFDVLRHGPYF